MKKLLATLMIFVLVFSVAVSAANVDKMDTKAPKDEKLAKQMERIEKFREKSDDRFEVQFAKENGNPRYIKGSLSDKPVKTAEEAALYLEANKDLFRVATGSFEVKKVNKDELGMTHFRTAYTVDGIPVYGGDLFVHTDKGGNVVSMNGLVDSSVPEKTWKNEIKLNTEAAIKAAEAALGVTPTYTVKPEAKQYLYKANGVWQAVYLVTLNFSTPYPANMVTFVNATNGSIVLSYNAIKDAQVTGTGINIQGQTKTLNLEYENGKYRMIDKSRPTTIITSTANYVDIPAGYACPPVEDTDNVFDAPDQRVAVSAATNMQVIYDYWKNTFNRNSYDGNGTDIKMVVHVGDKFNNAYWDSMQIAFGDGDGIKYKDFAGCLDVIAHEYGHANEEKISGIAYMYQTGAICEHIADVWAHFVDSDDWYIGEGVTCDPNRPAIRSMSDPHSVNNQPDNMSEYVDLPFDYDGGGVHIYSGIPNKAFYNACMAMNDNNKMAQIYYRAMSQYFFTLMEFTDLRNCLADAAEDLYGSSAATIINDAFLSVGINPNTNDTFEPNDNIRHAYAIESETVYNSYISTVDDVDLYKITVTTPGAIVADLSNLPGDYELYLLDSNGIVISSSERSGNANESINYVANAADTYYVKVKPYTYMNGDELKGYYSTTQAYALNVKYPNGAPLPALTYEPQIIESAHNYANNVNEIQTYTKAGATRVGVHFSKIETEAHYDYVKVLDKDNNVVAAFDGTYTDITIEVPGDTVKIQLTSDSSVVKYGYQVDKVGYIMQ